MPYRMLPTKNLPFSLPVLSGLFLVLCQPPVSLFPLAFVALTPLLVDIYGRNLRQSFLRGFVTGLVAFTGLVYWVVVSMNTYGGLSPTLSLLVLALLVSYLALYVGFFAWSVTYFQSKGLESYLTAPLIWVALEYGRGFLLSGFPWSFLAHSQQQFLPLIQIASVTGTYFVSYLLVAVSAIASFVIRRRTVPWPFFAATTLLVVISIAFGINRLQVSEKGDLRTAIIQGNMPQDVKWDADFKAYTIATYRDLTIQHGGGAALVLWPETAMPFIFDDDPAQKVISEIPVAVSSPLLFGNISQNGLNRYYNSATALGSDGTVLGTYSKVHLVPFGEFTPLREYFPFLANISVQIGDFFSGDSHRPIATGDGALGVLICFEGVFPTITNETVRRGATVLVNMTNDAWFGRSSAAYQHLGFYVFRAIETDRWVLRAANTGFSAIIDPQGHIRARTGLFEKTALTGHFAMKQSQTFYVRHGDYFMILVGSAILFFLLYALLPRGSKKH